ncbi:MAG: hypothetical protein Q8R13_04145 [bacterium]|nr:hypothetical protein [bacterium]MDZ4296479.1 hypothetical protein [Patescibacteria group bacterium]
MPEISDPIAYVDFLLSQPPIDRIVFVVKIIAFVVSALAIVGVFVFERKRAAVEERFKIKKPE